MVGRPLEPLSILPFQSGVCQLLLPIAYQSSLPGGCLRAAFGVSFKTESWPLFTSSFCLACWIVDKAWFQVK
jgi:hypothetical protein